MAHCPPCLPDITHDSVHLTSMAYVQRLYPPPSLYTVTHTHKHKLSRQMTQIRTIPIESRLLCRYKQGLGQQPAFSLQLSWPFFSIPFYNTQDLLNKFIALEVLSLSFVCKGVWFKVTEAAKPIMLTYWFCTLLTCLLTCMLILLGPKCIGIYLPHV